MKELVLIMVFLVLAVTLDGIAFTGFFSLVVLTVVLFEVAAESDANSFGELMAYCKQEKKFIFNSWLTVCLIGSAVDHFIFTPMGI